MAKTIRLISVDKTEKGEITLTFDNDSAIYYKNQQMMIDAFNRFEKNDQDGLMMMLIVGDYIKRGDSTIGCVFDPDNPTAVWCRRIN
jgi:hypothetical protein